jgi:hypothetical protein
MTFAAAGREDALMAFVLLLIGVAIIVAGVAMIGFGIPINEFNLGNTLIVSGMTMVAGGLVVFALSFVLRQLTRIANSLAGRPAAPAGRMSGEPLDPMHPGSSRPAAPRAPFPSGSRPDAPRDPRTSDPRMTSHGTEPGLALPPRNVEPSLVGDIDEAPLSPRPPLRTSAPAAEQPERKSWLPGNRPRVARPGAGDTPRAPEAPAERSWSNERMETPALRGNGDATRHTAEPAKPDAPVTVLKSGVVDGMAYTLYTDGSIEAELAQGVVRFGSIEELRNHLEKSS